MTSFAFFITGFVAGIAATAFIISRGVKVDAEVTHRVERPKDEADWWKDMDP